MYGWSTRPTKVEVKHFLGGDSPAAVFEVGRYQITIQGVTQDSVPEITYVTDSRRSGDPRQTFPNMEVTDGVLRIPVEDIVEEMLTRLDPVDLARALWSSKGEVMDAFMHCMVENYTDGSLSDEQRRKFLLQIKEAIHSTAVGRLAERFSDSEYALAKSCFFWNQVNRANQMLEHAEKRVRAALGQPLEPTDEQTEVFKLPRLRDDEQDPIFKIAGTAWNECRAYWRGKVAELFPGPGPGPASPVPPPVEMGHPDYEESN